jgi:hypothetical protein
MRTISASFPRGSGTFKYCPPLSIVKDRDLRQTQRVLSHNRHPQPIVAAGFTKPHGVGRHEPRHRTIAVGGDYLALYQSWFDGFGWGGSCTATPVERD